MWMAVVYVITGIVLVLGASLGAVMLIARGIAMSNAHDQKTCECWDCKDRRARAVIKAMRKRDGRDDIPWVQTKRRDELMKVWMCTEDLVVGTRVQGATPDKVYEVADMRGSEYGVVVSLISEKTGKRSIVTVGMGNMQKKMWKKAGRA